ncbi:glycosyltransferase family 4 protein [Cupriavidus basilensis]|uniref:glycosyltransferase family 4 protein n=1 Tax=Cupriavidus basilensis TaxID=68895 RepID=UPI00157AB864|nr:glycosyltransferase family 4 protein [Cupriavidus basilensis]NUA28966.1 glycosyltransferase family 4 protein [Cupriavidus basilensis]
MKALVTHPGLQHSHQMAQALYEHDMLKQYWSGVPVRAPGEAPPWWLPPGYHAKVREVAIPKALRRHPVFFPGVLKLGLNRYVGRSGSAYAHRIFHLFDQWVATQVEALGPDVVVAYENSASRTFAAAKRIGARCVLEAPSVHHRAAEAMLPTIDTSYLAQINAHKDREVELADLIITCSAFAAQSYIDAGVPASKIKPILLGASLPDSVVRRRPESHLRFVFAGGVTRRKAVDLLLEAFAKLREVHHDVELVIVGGIDDALIGAQIAASAGVTCLGSLPQGELFQVFADADCFILPSRFDSFGMVVAEALACGTPALVTDHVGAKEIIEEFPRAGWIVPVGMQALHAQMLEMANNRGLLRDARMHAGMAGRKFTWARYRHAAAETVAALC